MKKTPVAIFKRLGEILHSGELKQEFRTSDVHFTRNRKQTFSKTSLALIQIIKIIQSMLSNSQHPNQ